MSCVNPITAPSHSYQIQAYDLFYLQYSHIYFISIFILNPLDLPLTEPVIFGRGAAKLLNVSLWRHWLTTSFVSKYLAACFDWRVTSKSKCVEVDRWRFAKRRFFYWLMWRLHFSVAFRNKIVLSSQNGFPFWCTLFQWNNITFQNEQGNYKAWTINHIGY